MKAFHLWFIICGLFLLPPVGLAQYTLLYQTNGSVITLVGYTGTPVNLDIPNFVTSISSSMGLRAFEYCSSLVSITIPDSVTNIGQATFASCASLTSVTIPDSVTSLGQAAFYQDGSLSNVIIGNGITSLELSTFTHCTNLISVTIPNSVTYIANDSPPLAAGEGVFEFDSNLKSVIGGNGLITIGGSAFEHCSSLANIPLGSNITTIGLAAFEDCFGLTNIIIPNSVTNIEEYAFVYCTNLTSILFTGNAPSIQPDAFSGENPTAYYLTGTTGWDSLGMPATLWNPQIQTSNNFGIANNQFSFTITGTTNIPIVLEASTNLAIPAWTPLQSCNLTNGSIYFTDSQFTNYTSRFYSIAFP